MDWNEKFRSWVKENPDDFKKLKSQITQRSLDWYLYKTKGVSHINLGARVKLYKATKIEEFRPDNYIDPETFGVEDIIKRKVPSTAIEIWLGYNDIAKTDFAKRTGIHRDSLTSYINGAKVKDFTLVKIISGLRKYASEGPSRRGLEAEEVDKVLRTAGEGIGRGNDGRDIVDLIERGFDDLKQYLDKLNDKSKVKPSKDGAALSDKLKQLDVAIDSLVDAMEYYKGQGRDVRMKLASYLARTNQLHRFGWAWNVYGGLSRREDDPDSFARSTKPPEKNKA